MDLREELQRLIRRGDVEGFNEVSRRRRQIVDLSDSDFTAAHLEGVDLRDAILDGVRFARAHLAGADFRGASLRFANFDHADLEGARFGHANLYSVYFAQANMQAVDLHGADIQAAVFPDDIRPEELRLALDMGTRLRRDPTVELLRRVLAGR